MNDVSNDVNLDAQLPSSSWRRFVLDLRRRIDPIVSHGIAMNALILCMALSELTLNLTMGHGACFYDVVPVRYLVQTVDLILLVRFTANVWREFR